LTFDFEIDDRVTCGVGWAWANSVPILVFLGLSVRDLGPMYATDRRQTSDRETDVRCASSLNAPAMGAGHQK